MSNTAKEPTNIHSQFNACMYQAHCKRLESQAADVGAAVAAALEWAATVCEDLQQQYDHEPIGFMAAERIRSGPPKPERPANPPTAA